MNTTTQAIIAACVRQALTAFGAYFAIANLDTNMIDSVAGFAAIVVSTAWSIWQKRKTVGNKPDVVVPITTIKS